MKPALSIVFFTVVSGAGLGLLALVAFTDVFFAGSLPARAVWRGALLGLVLVAAGLASSLLHLANPKNAWRSFARFRSSWLSREAVFAVALFVVAASYVALVFGGAEGAARVLTAAATVLLAWAVMFSTAMIYASLKPIRQWHTFWTPLNYLLLGHWSGALLLAAMVCAYAADTTPFLAVAAVLGLLGLAAKVAYWRAFGERSAASADALTIERAIGVPSGVHGPGPVSVMHARLLDVGHSHATFLTREFGFELARRHAALLRALSLLLGFAVPLLWLASDGVRWQTGVFAALCGMIGLLAERWLFFAEARHTVRLYHGDTHT
jgi:DMSO reductase anchor subunit